MQGRALDARADMRLVALLACDPLDAGGGVAAGVCRGGPQRGREDRCESDEPRSWRHRAARENPFSCAGDTL
jgi:hypothetical protein